MPLQNRVTPFGEIIATTARGMFTGNRGILHRAGRQLTDRRWTSRAWLTCACDWKGIRREVMTGRKWTELFFLDEATALAAGHRPCFLCRREAAERFRIRWPGKPAAAEIDRILHLERLNGRQKRLHPMQNELPVGAMAAGGDTAWLWVGHWLRWSPSGYESVSRAPRFDGLLTPPTTLAVLRAGYRPVLHPAATLSTVER